MTDLEPTAVGACPPLPTSVLWKAFDVLDAFSRHHRVLTLSELARASGLPKSTVHRVVGMLCDVGAVEQVDGGYRIGLRMLTMASTSPEVGLREVALPHLLDLHRAVGRTVHLGALRDGEVVYLDKLPDRSAPVPSTAVGTRLPAHCTGVGKALLAAGPSPTRDRLARLTPASITDPRMLARELDRVRHTGVATEHDEAVPGLSCVARPVLVAGTAVVAVSVVVPSSAAGSRGLLGPLGRAVHGLGSALAQRPDLVAHLAPARP